MKRIVYLLLAILASAPVFAQDSLNTPPCEEWAQVNLSIAHLRTTKGNASELCSQEYLGMPVKVLEKDGGWWKIESTDGYNGWMSKESLIPKSEEELAAWREADRLVVTSQNQISAFATPTTESPRDMVTDLVPCDIVEGNLDVIENGRVQITLPDGRTMWAEASCFTPIQEWASQEFDSEKILDQAYRLIGTPYLWGGNSVKALDCSGLSKICYLTNGIFLLRDASMQVNTGQPLDIAKWQDFEQGDLLFFGNAKTGKITHVAIYDTDSYYVHSTGYGDRVRRTSIDPNNPDQGRAPMLQARRIKGMEDTPGIVKAINHPWLFTTLK